MSTPGASDKAIAYGGGTVTTSGVTTSASGSGFYALVIYDDSADSVQSVSDNKGNTYVRIGTQVNAGTVVQAMERWYCESGNGGAGHTLTATLASGYASYKVYATLLELVGGAQLVANSSSAMGTAWGSEPWQPGSITLASAALMVSSAWNAIYDDTSTWSETSSPTPFTIQSYDNDAITQIKAVVGTLAASAGAVNAAWNNSTAGSSAAIIVQDGFINASTGGNTYNDSVGESLSVSGADASTAQKGMPADVDEYESGTDMASAGGWAFVAAGSTATGTNPTPALPTGHQAGDLLIIVAASGTAYSTTPPTGWTILAQRTTASPMLTVFGKIDSGSETAPTLTNSATSSVAAMGCWRRTRPTTTADVTSGINTGTSSSPATTSITTTKDGDLVLSAYADAVGTARTWNAAPSGTVNRLSAANSASLCGIRLNDESKTPAGATTARTNGLSGSATWNAVAIALFAQAVYQDFDNETAAPVDGQTATGGSVAVTDSATGTDAQAAQAAFVSVGAEAGSPADAQAAGMVAAVSQPESGTGTDAQAGVRNVPAAQGESGAGTDAQAAQAAFAPAGAESATPADAPAATFVAGVAGAESGAPSDTQSTTGQQQASQGESGTGSDAQAAALATPQGVGETGSGTDTIAGVGAFGVLRGESASPGDTSTVQAGVPAAPTIVAVQPSRLGAVVWVSAASNGGSPLTKYTAVAYIGGTPAGITAEQSYDASYAGVSGRITVRGLSAGQAYTFRVYATNANGDGALSSESGSVTAGAYSDYWQLHGFAGGLQTSPPTNFYSYGNGTPTWDLAPPNPPNAPTGTTIGRIVEASANYNWGLGIGHGLNPDGSFNNQGNGRLDTGPFVYITLKVWPGATLHPLMNFWYERFYSGVATAGTVAGTLKDAFASWPTGFWAGANLWNLTRGEWISVTTQPDGQTLTFDNSNAFQPGDLYEIGIPDQVIGVSVNDISAYAPGGVLTPNQWNVVNIPLTAFDDSGTTDVSKGDMLKFAIASNTSTPQTYYIADLGYVQTAQSLGGNYNVTDAESASGTDATATQTAFAPAAAETASPGDAAQAQAVVGAAQPESASGADTPAALSGVFLLDQEAASPADAPAVSSTAWAAVQAEAGTGADAAAATAAYQAAEQESGTGTDAQAAGKVIAATQPEAGTPTDTASMVRWLLDAIGEAVAGADAAGAQQAAGVVVVEQRTASDLAAASPQWPVSVAEVSSPADLVRWVTLLVADPAFRVDAPTRVFTAAQPERIMVATEPTRTFTTEDPRHG